MYRTCYYLSNNPLSIGLVVAVTVLMLLFILWSIPISYIMIRQWKATRLHQLKEPLAVLEQNKQQNNLALMNKDNQRRTGNLLNHAINELKNLRRQSENKLREISEKTQQNTEKFLSLKADINKNISLNKDSSDKQWQIIQKYVGDQNQNSSLLIERSDEARHKFEESADKINKLMNFNDELCNKFDILSEIRNIFLSPHLKGEFAERNCLEIINSVLGHKSDLLQVQKEYRVKGLATFRPDFTIQGHDQMKSIIIDAKCPTKKYTELIKENTQKNRKSFESSFAQIINDFSKYTDGLADEVALFCIFIPSDRMFMDIMEHHYDEIFTKAIKKNIFLAAPSNLIYCLQLFRIIRTDYNVNQSVFEVKKLFDKIKKNYYQFFTKFDKISGAAARLSEAVEKLVRTRNAMETAFEKLDTAAEIAGQASSQKIDNIIPKNHNNSNQKQNPSRSLCVAKKNIFEK